MECKTVNALRLTHPLLESFVLKTYHGIIKNTPEVWDHVYDNLKIKERLENFRKFVHRVKAGKLLKLLQEQQPDALVCTQAFPCGLIADRKTQGEITAPVIAVITDYAVHAYWVYEGVDLYVVPSEGARQQLLSYGIPAEKILALGIPVSPKFTDQADPSRIKKRYGLSSHLPLVLVMGGGQGLGPMKQIVQELDKLPTPLEIVVLAGTNKLLQSSLEYSQKKFHKRVMVHGYLREVAPLMSIADILIGKPGGLTISEAMASALPMILIDPIPGQEVRNAGFLLREKVAALANDAAQAAHCVQDWLEHPCNLQEIRDKIKVLRKPQAAARIAQEILKRAGAQSLVC